MKETPKTPSAFLSLLPLIVLVLMLVATVRAYGSDSLSDRTLNIIGYMQSFRDTHYFLGDT